MIGLIRNYMKIFIIAFYFLFFFNSCFALEKKETTRFIAIGHLYPMIDDKKRLIELFKKINSHDPDYVFILGDSKLHKIEYINEFKNNLKGQIFFSPGNHEVKRFKSDYEKNIGYLNKIIEDKNTRFILLNSSDTKENVQNFLKKSLNTDKSIYILTHHRIWDDTLMSKKSYEHDKSYYFEDIYPLIRDKVKAIFAGNSKRQHFRDLSDDMLTYGKQNVNLIYWLDKIGEIELYSIGMGDGKPKANFVIVDISGDEMFVKGDYSSIENYDVLPKDLISPNEQRLNMFHDTQKIKDLVKSKYFLVNKKKIIFASLILIVIFLILIFKIYKKNEKQP